MHYSSSIPAGSRSHSFGFRAISNRAADIRLARDAHTAQRRPISVNRENSIRSVAFSDESKRTLALFSLRANEALNVVSKPTNDIVSKNRKHSACLD
ncbi:hypothetical protein EVAR_9035_1 [Eumeta japonica]|uniref:Uncharacterized protein n=1 Tax=Eumeta variegata TaxID=151549 RepID=A0A4C1TVX0_EUMVA|nr:hypothetical protein EVAR_9035_1 [Eumeta japonica]